VPLAVTAPVVPVAQLPAVPALAERQIRRPARPPVAPELQAEPVALLAPVRAADSVVRAPRAARGLALPLPVRRPAARRREAQRHPALSRRAPRPEREVAERVVPRPRLLAPIAETQRRRAVQVQRPMQAPAAPGQREPRRGDPETVELAVLRRPVLL
jgi:hypothetical protein